MTVLSNINYFNELPFYNSFIEKPVIKHLLIKNYKVNFQFIKVFLKNQILQNIRKLLKIMRTGIQQSVDSQDLSSQLSITRV